MFSLEIQKIGKSLSNGHVLAPWKSICRNKYQNSSSAAYSYIHHVLYGTTCSYILGDTLDSIQPLNFTLMVPLHTLGILNSSIECE